MMSGNKISVKTLDLDCDFSEIANQLNKIVELHFGIEVRCQNESWNWRTCSRDCFAEHEIYEKLKKMQSGRKS